MKKIVYMLGAVLSLGATIQNANAQFYACKEGQIVYSSFNSTPDSITFHVPGFMASENVNEVDLDLPSGTLWADRNVGAPSANDCGVKFAWGTTALKERDSWGDYEHTEIYISQETEAVYTKYTKEDGKKVLDPEDDAATVNMGDQWFTPTEAMFEELLENCNWEFKTNYRNTGNPACIVRNKEDESKYIVLLVGTYWTSECSNDEIANYFWVLDQTNLELNKPGKIYGMFKFDSHYVRPVTKDASLLTGKNLKMKAVDLGLPSGIYWADMDLDAESEATYGAPYAWGETEPKTEFTRETYSLCESKNVIKNKVTMDNYGVDENYHLYSDYSSDAAYRYLGEGWAIPSREQVQELLDECDWSLDNTTGVYTATSKYNGKSISFPCGFWINELKFVESKETSFEAYYFLGKTFDSKYRYLSMPVRGVKSTK